ncbi:MAG TPA: transglycosylase domain-containing protein [Burkholderiaceae bacterium]|nr:transglycosylase domain-containing protein [Burkholderiaceae bacterium]
MNGRAVESGVTAGSRIPSSAVGAEHAAGAGYEVRFNARPQDASPATEAAASTDTPVAPAPRPGKRLIVRAEFWFAVLACLIVLLEANRPYLESLFVWGAVTDMTFKVQSGPSPAIRFPQSGPYDQRLGYVGLPSLIQRLKGRGFEIVRQARQSPGLLHFIEAGGFAVYHEKSQAGLVLNGRAGRPLEAEPYPSAAYKTFDEIPPLVVDTLRFIEDRHLLDPTHPYRNPAVEWHRFALAAAGRLGGVLDHDLRRGGASTLATQIEKYRHSPAGRTEGVSEKMRQMATATARAYLDGPETMAAQQQIITTYLDSTPLGSRPGYGEVIGFGDGLLAWFGVDFADANRFLSRRPASDAEARWRAQIYKEALSLLIAQRRPSYYLNAGRTDLERLTNAHLRALASAGVIDPGLRDAALKRPLAFTLEAPALPLGSFVQRKAVDAVRTELMTALGVPDVYSLDRLDLSAAVSIDGSAQAQVAELLEQLKDPQAVKELGLVGDQLLGGVDPSKVAWSVVVYERGRDRNLVRIHADSLDQPFDINSEAKLILGSTAKLRTLATYLGIIDRLYQELATATTPELRRVAATTGDPLRRWAADYLMAVAPERRALQPMLDAAMQRRYSASPSEEFFTGGGIHVFHNFERPEDFERPTVEQAFARSINLAFVRLLRDVIRHYEADLGARAEVLTSDDNPLRMDLLRRFADREGSVYLNRFYSDYAGRSPDQALDQLAAHAQRSPRRLIVMFRSVRPDASVADMRDFLARRIRDVPTEQSAADLYARYGTDRFSLDDRGFLAGVHPLELWLVAYLQHHPKATRSQVIAASASERQQAYGWLFKTGNTHKQDIRIKGLVEEEAFDRVLQDWKRQGYPFNHLVPSLATAIGSSGDRPEALSTLMGIILNGGVKQPTTDLERLHFAAGTPYDTEMAYRPEAPERVFSEEVAATLRRALAGVVDQGTATRVRGVYVDAHGKALPIGGKTGTGDNRFESFGPGHRLIEARPVDRTATFVFFLGDRLYGTVTAYVSGPEAGSNHFTSALAVSLLKALAPALQPLLEPDADRSTVRHQVVASNANTTASGRIGSNTIH